MNNLEQMVKDGYPLGLAIESHLLNSNSSGAIRAAIETLRKHLSNNSEAMNLLNQLNAFVTTPIHDEIIDVVTKVKNGAITPSRLDKDHVTKLASEFGVANKYIGRWRRRHVRTLASAKPMTLHDIGLEVSLTGQSLRKLVDDMVFHKQLIQAGDTYTTAPPATSTST
jgi:hypothetical protein